MENPKEKSPDKKYSPEDFTKALEELSKEMGYILNFSPQFFQQDNGTFSLKIVVNVVVKNK